MALAEKGNGLTVTARFKDLDDLKTSIAVRQKAQKKMKVQKKLTSAMKSLEALNRKHTHLKGQVDELTSQSNALDNAISSIKKVYLFTGDF